MLAKRPMLTLAACFSGGIVLANYASRLSVYISAALLLAALVVVLYAIKSIDPKTQGTEFYKESIINRLGADKILFVLGALVIIFGGSYFSRTENTLKANNQLLTEIIGKSKPTGVFEILEPPESSLVDNEGGYWKMRVRVVSINKQDIFAKDILLLLYGKGQNSFTRGSTILGRFHLYPFRTKPYPGAFTYKEYLQENGLCARAKLYSGSWKTGGSVKTESLWLKFRRQLDSIRSAAISNTLRLMPNQAGAFLAAAMFGYREGLDDSTKDLFREVGIGHILAISGLHVGLVCVMAWWFFALFTADKRKTAFFCIGLCLLFLALSGGRTAALRAGIIACIYLTGFILSRRGDFLNSLGAAAVLILILNPYTLFNAGFQLSFFAVIFISCCDKIVAPLLTKRDEGNNDLVRKPFFRRTFDKFIMLIIMSVSAWLGVWPIAAHEFNEVAFSGLITNLGALPLMSVTLVGGIVLQFGAFLPEHLAGIWAMLAGLPAQLMLQLAAMSDKIPGGGVNMFSPPDWVMVFYYGGFALLFLRKMLRRLSKVIAILGAVLAGAAFVVMLYTGLVPVVNSASEITILPSEYGVDFVGMDTTGSSAVTSFSRKGSNLWQYLYSRRINQLDNLVVISNIKPDTALFTDKVRVNNIIHIPYKLPKESTTDSSYNESLELGAEKRLFLSREKKGKIVWRSLGNGELSVLSAGWLRDVQYNFRAVRKYPGWDANLIFTRVSGCKHEKLDIPEKSTVFHSNYQGKGYNASKFGVIRLLPGKIQAFNGTKWLEIGYSKQK